MSQNICTSQELKDFADTSEITIPELSKFIEEKTNKKYLVIIKRLHEGNSQKAL